MYKLGCLAVVAAALAVVPAPAKAQNVVTCESEGGRRQTCSVDTRRGEVRLVRQFSEARCVRGRSWGVIPGGVWVDDGCRGQFAVSNTSRGGNDGRYGGRDPGRTTRDDRWRGDNGRGDRGDSWALSRCRTAVERRYGNRRVNVWMENNSRNNARVGWRTNRGVRGTCRVDRDGRVDVRVDRNRNR